MREEIGGGGGLWGDKGRRLQVEKQYYLNITGRKFLDGGEHEKKGEMQKRAH